MPFVFTLHYITSSCKVSINSISTVNIRVHFSVASANRISVSLSIVCPAIGSAPTPTGSINNFADQLQSMHADMSKNMKYDLAIWSAAAYTVTVSSKPHSIIFTLLRERRKKDHGVITTANNYGFKETLLAEKYIEMAQHQFRMFIDVLCHHTKNMKQP